MLQQKIARISWNAAMPDSSATGGIRFGEDKGGSVPGMRLPGI